MKEGFQSPSALQAGERCARQLPAALDEKGRAGVSQRRRLCEQRPAAGAGGVRAAQDPRFLPPSLSEWDCLGLFPSGCHSLVLWERGLAFYFYRFTDGEGGIKPGTSPRSNLDAFDNGIGTFESELEKILFFALILQCVEIWGGGLWMGVYKCLQMKWT